MAKTAASKGSEKPAPCFIAHRGYSGKYPENTLLAYAAAREAGALQFELDLQLSADRVPFLHHDKSLLRMAGVDADFRDLKAKQIKKLSASYSAKFGDDFASNRFTTFNHYCQWLKQDHQLLTFVEIKQESIDRWGIPVVMKAVLKRIKRHKVQSQCVIISFNPEVVEYTRKVSKLKCGWVLPAWGKDEQQIAEQLKPEYLFCWVDYLPSTNTELWLGPWEWALYNVDDVPAAKAMLCRGFTNLETNEIGALLEHPDLAKLLSKPKL